MMVPFVAGSQDSRYAPKKKKRPSPVAGDGRIEETTGGRITRSARPA
jgi:hypothetical protein